MDTEEEDIEEASISWYWDEEDEVNRCFECGWEFFKPRRYCFNSSCPAHDEAPEGSLLWDDTSYELEDPAYLPEELHEKKTQEERLEEEEEGSENEYLLDDFCVDDLDELVVDSEVEDLSDDSAKDETDDDTIDWKASYEAMNTKYQRALYDLGNLADDFDNYRRDVEGDIDSFMFSEDDNSALLNLSDEHENDGEGTLYGIINVDIQDPPLTEVILPLVSGGSQDSALGPERVADRVAGFNAALDENGWQVPMMSTGDNHTSLSQEL